MERRDKIKKKKKKEMTKQEPKSATEQFDYARLDFLEKIAGKTDPFDFGMHEVGKYGDDGMSHKPIEIPSMYNERLFACVCEDDVQSIQWMTIKTGETKKCGCGLWFKFVDLNAPATVDPINETI